jgi:aminoglycoside phosphotransferase (APT) family kinase protein
MIAEAAQLPPRRAIHAVLEELYRDYAVDYDGFRVRLLRGSYSNFTHLIIVEFEDESTREIVMRRYNPEKYEDGHDKQSCEFHALKLLHKHGLPVPPPLLLDETGELLGLPGIVTEFVEGAPIELPAEAALWGEMAEKTARMLARIHQTPFSEADKRFLMDDNVEVAWFIKDGVIPNYMRIDPDGEMVWHLVKDHWARWKPIEPRFAHTDYWAGNILWQGDEIATVVDWEEAGYGHPAADVAYCRMSYFIEGVPEAAQTFLRVYEAEAGWTLSDLPLFELAASARPMTDPEDWFAHPYMQEGFRRFIAQAKEQLLAGG